MAQSVVVDLNAVHFNKESVDERDIIIEINIKGNMPISVLKELEKGGRYQIEGILKEDNYILTAPNIEKVVVVRGKDLEEEVTVTVKASNAYILAHNTLKIDMSLFTPRCCISPEETKKMYGIKNKLSTQITFSSSLKADIQLKIKTGDIIVDGQPLAID